MTLDLALQHDPFDLLHKPAQLFDFNQYDAQAIEAEMIKIMHQNQGIGLAANQVGLDAQIFVMGSHMIRDFPKPFAIINPEIIEVSENKILDREGCLSFPGIWLTVTRPEWIITRYTNARGGIEEVKIDGYLAKCFQHEFDHLHGICYTDRVSKLKLEMAQKKKRKYEKNG